MPRAKAVASAVLLTIGLVGCVSSAVDPRCTIHAPNDDYRGRLAKAVNGSKLWQAYFDHVSPDKASAEPLVEVDLQMDRKVTGGGSGGDYDPGEVRIRFTVTNLRNGAMLYKEEKKAQLDSVIFGRFDENATREDIQNAAFAEAEDDVFPFISRWVDIAAIRAMGQLSWNGEALVPILEEQVENPWAEDLSSEAKRALRAIREAL